MEGLNPATSSFVRSYLIIYGCSMRVHNIHTHHRMSSPQRGRAQGEAATPQSTSTTGTYPSLDHNGSNDLGAITFSFGMASRAFWAESRSRYRMRASPLHLGGLSSVRMTRRLPTCHRKTVLSFELSVSFGPDHQIQEIHEKTKRRGRGEGGGS